MELDDPFIHDANSTGRTFGKSVDIDGDLACLVYNQNAYLFIERINGYNLIQSKKVRIVPYQEIQLLYIGGVQFSFTSTIKTWMKLFLFKIRFLLKLSPGGTSNQ